MVLCGSALFATVFGNLTAGEDAGLLSRDKKTLLSFIPFFRSFRGPEFGWGGTAGLSRRIDFVHKG